MTNTHRPNQPQRRRSVQASPPQAVATVQQPCSIGTLLGGNLVGKRETVQGHVRMRMYVYARCAVLKGCEANEEQSFRCNI